MRKLLVLVIIFTPSVLWAAGADSTRASLHVVKRGDSTLVRATGRIVVEDSVVIGNPRVPSKTGGRVDSFYVKHLNVTTVTTAVGTVTTASIDSNQIVNGGIAPADLSDTTNAAWKWGRANIQTSAVDSTKILTGTVSGTNLRADAVDSAKVRTGGVAGSDLSSFLGGNHTVTGDLRTLDGQIVGSNLATGRRAEWFTIAVIIQESGGSVNQFQVVDAANNPSGTSTLLTAGFHTTAGAVTATEAATSAGDADANRVFRDSDNNSIHIKKMTGSTPNPTTTLINARIYLNEVDVVTVQGINAEIQVADANFTSSPAAIVFTLLNSSGASINPFALTTAGTGFRILLSGMVIY